MAYSRDLADMDCHGLSWMTFMVDFHVWHSWLTLWLTFMDDFHGWLSWMTFTDDFHGWLSCVTFMEDTNETTTMQWTLAVPSDKHLKRGKFPTRQLLRTTSTQSGWLKIGCWMRSSSMIGSPMQWLLPLLPLPLDLHFKVVCWHDLPCLWCQ